MLSASARNWAFKLSRIEKVLKSETSKLICPGPRSEITRPTLPNENCGASERQHVHHLMRDNATQRASEQLIPVREVVAGHGGSDSGGHFVARDFTVRLDFAGSRVRV